MNVPGYLAIAVIAIAVCLPVARTALPEPCQAATPIAPAAGLLASAIIADHNRTDISQVPPAWIASAKSTLKIWYGHTSHGSQVTTGMENLRSAYGVTYNFNSDGTGGALSYREISGDLGVGGDLGWRDTTRSQLDQPDNDRNMVIWSWCGGASTSTQGGINVYLATMNQLEIDYPGVRFVYMTGHLDGSGVAGNLNARNNQIRSYCRANNKILFDFADIESYDPDGNYFLDRNANDGCDYTGGNWAQEWCAAHSSPGLCATCDCAHSQPLNCNLKARAFWWMLAQVAGGTLPAVINMPAIGITSTTAILNGNLTTDGGETTTVDIYIGTTDGGTTPSNWNRVKNLYETTVGDFFEPITGLTPRTTYYYRCSATNAAGTAWAPATSSFITKSVWIEYWEGPGKDWWRFSSGRP